MNKPEKAVLVIFGASGDLAQRKLIPALFSLYIQDLMPESYSIVGVSRSLLSDSEFAMKMKIGILEYMDRDQYEAKELDAFISKLSYFSIDFNSVKDFIQLKEDLNKIETTDAVDNNYLFHFALPPEMFERVALNISKSGLSEDSEGYRRMIIEKPFGYDLESGNELNNKLHKAFSEDQIYRIDHYLGKETVQNLLVTRFANGIFEPLWNRNYIDHVEITSSESIGVENRGGYYEKAGALRDMVQNHILQMVGITAMEPPAEMDADAIRNEILKVLLALRPIPEEEVEKHVIRGQYVESTIKGNDQLAYRDEKGVDSDSRTETYVAIRFFIDNWRWGGVPFYIRTGKKLPTKVTEIVIHFKPTPHYLFSKHEKSISGNQLIIRIQPDEGILLKFDMKMPGAGFKVNNVNMDFHYKDLSDVRIPGAYERLLYDAMIGDSTLFARGDAVEASWKFIKPIQDAWKNNSEIKLHGYPGGSWGPENADDLLDGTVSTWRYPCKNLSDDGLFCEL